MAWIYAVFDYVWFKQCVTFNLHDSLSSCVYQILFTNIFCLLDLQKTTKKRTSSVNLVLLSYFTFWYELNNFVFIYLFLLSPMHVLNSVFWICVTCFNIYDDHMVRFYYLTISRKRVPWKFWLDPRFPWNPKLKQILKWLPLDRGCFKVYFSQKGKVF